MPIFSSITSIAPSVGEPMKLCPFPASRFRKQVELVHTLSANRARPSGDRVVGVKGAWSPSALPSPWWMAEPCITFTTVIRFSVSVPVLSVHTHVAWPMVSLAPRWRTKQLSCIILNMEKARDMVTARGRPSGTARTTMVMPITKFSASRFR
jgi:hypothetical protein